MMVMCPRLDHDPAIQQHRCLDGRCSDVVDAIFRMSKDGLCQDCLSQNIPVTVPLRSLRAWPGGSCLLCEILRAGGPRQPRRSQEEAGRRVCKGR